MNFYATQAHATNSIYGKPDDAAVKERQALHRAVMRGNGFYQWMVSDDVPSTCPEETAVADEDLATTLSKIDLGIRKLKKLPVVNFTTGVDKTYLENILEELLPQDRDRARQYFRDRPLGLGLFTAVSSLTSRLAGSTDISRAPDSARRR